MGGEEVSRSYLGSFPGKKTLNSSGLGIFSGKSNFKKVLKFNY